MDLSFKTSKRAFIIPLILFFIVFLIWTIITTIISVINRQKSERDNKDVPNYQYKMPYWLVLMWIVSGLIFIVGVITTVTIFIIKRKDKKILKENLQVLTENLNNMVETI